VSVTMMAACTVLISCLPTYAQAGMAAPILLALLRAIQGLAMGGALVVLRTRGLQSVYTWQVWVCHGVQHWVCSSPTCPALKRFHVHP
jgi:hypothetical protein